MSRMGESLMVLTVLLRYRLVTRHGRSGRGRSTRLRPSRALPAGLVCGALLVGGLVVAAPAGVLPAGLQVALGSAAAPPTSAAAAAEPTRRLPPDLPALAAPPTTTPAPPTSATAPSTTQTGAPAPTTAPPPTPVPPPTGGAAAAVVALTNDARVAAGCAPLRTDARITTAAQAHSTDMAEKGYFDHNSPDGRDPGDRMVAAGYPTPGGENIARGQRDAAEVVQAWLDSPGHRRNIEDCSFTTIGVGLDERGNYWTQDFGR